MRYITEDYRKQIENIIENGGTLWVVERIDTHQFAFERMLFGHVHQPQSRLEWVDDLTHIGGEYYAYLSKDDFATDNLILSIGACEHCGSGGTEIPIIVVEHEFVPTKTTKSSNN